MYSVKLIFRISPAYLPVSLCCGIITKLFREFFSAVILLKGLLTLIEGGDFRRFIRYLLIFTAISLVCPAISRIDAYISTVCREKSSIYLNKLLFRKASEMDISLFENPGFYDTYQRATDVAKRSTVFSIMLSCTDLVSSVITAATAIGYVITVDWRFLFLAALGIPALFLKKKMITLFREKRVKTTPNDRAVIFISHRLSTTRHADRIAMMENGKIIELGTHAELMAPGGKYAELFNMQAEKYLAQGT